MWFAEIFFVVLPTLHLVYCTVSITDDGLPIKRIRPVCKTHCPEEESAEFWTNEAQLTLYEHLVNIPYTTIAKNVILFLGDGMSLTTIVAARAYLGQKNNRSGEDLSLIFENFPYTGLVKTYCVDRQVADSACSATAYLGGVKANTGTVGVTGGVRRGDCEAMLNKTNQVSSIARWAQLAGKATGIVTTTRVTHASPAGTYAYTADRNWENDVEVAKSGCNPNVTRDIAHQLIYGETGQNFNVILGGGRKMFLPKGQFDEQNQEGSRNDGLNLIEEWKKSKSGVSQYVWNRNQLVNVNGGVQNLLGLFTDSHMSYNLDRDPNVEPSLMEMTEAAINVLSRNSNGYFLFVEGGMIDQAHHATFAHKALGDTLAFADAIQRAVDKTGRDDTLIVATADHGHTLTFNGYAGRGSNIFGLAGLGEDGLPYSILTYANGPGYAFDKSGKRRDLREDHMGKKDYRFPVQIPLSRETHDGEDVPIYALGPWAHLFSGAYEQNVIPHIMAYASCVGEGITACEQDMRKRRRKRSDNNKLANSHWKN